MFLQRSFPSLAVQRPYLCCHYVPYESPCLSYRQYDDAEATDCDKPLEPIENKIHINTVLPPQQTGGPTTSWNL